MNKRKRKSKNESSRVHSVQAELSVFELAKAKSALTLTISARREKLGEIEIGRGGLFWKGKNRKAIGKRISWTTFAEKMNELAYP